jgi:23S rRNA pseudouridine1911/1915/1917 synthase
VVTSSKHEVQAGDVVEMSTPVVVMGAPQPEAIALDVVFEDDVIVVINKPAGMSVHPGAGTPGGTVVNALLAHAPEAADAAAPTGDEDRPGVVHRLDKETSGVMVLAKTADALAALQAQFKARTIEKQYVAWCVGVPMHVRGEIRKPIGRHPKHRQRMAVMGEGREAITEYEVTATIARAGRSYALVHCHPHTGRTHQIRVHLASIGTPVVGDALYGGAPGARDPLSQQLTPRHLLHAQRLAFVHPRSGAPLVFEVPPPADFVIDAD